MYKEIRILILSSEVGTDTYTGPQNLRPCQTQVRGLDFSYWSEEKFPFTSNN